MYFDRKDLSGEELTFIYKKLLLPRLIEEKMLVLLRQGKISKWFSGIGQEAIAAGAALADAALADAARDDAFPATGRDGGDALALLLAPAAKPGSG